jgi:hypothetical protein
MSSTSTISVSPNPHIIIYERMINNTETIVRDVDTSIRSPYVQLTISLTVIFVCAICVGFLFILQKLRKKPVEKDTPVFNVRELFP